MWTQALFGVGSVHLVITGREPPYNVPGICGIMRTKILALFLGCLVAVTAMVAMGMSVSASGDNNCWNHGEDGKYEENNNNPFDDDTFPGVSDQKRGGVVWPDEPE